MKFFKRLRYRLLNALAKLFLIGNGIGLAVIGINPDVIFTERIPMSGDPDPFDGVIDPPQRPVRKT